MDHFKEMVSRDEDGKYAVCLPRKQPTPVLGKSRSQTARRFSSNKKTLIRKGTWPAFESGVHEYLDIGHAEEVPPDKVEAPDHLCYYLPMHGAVKEASTSTSTTISLNDTLLPGPCSYPKLTSVLNRFRTHLVGMSADVSKIFIEVVLDLPERDFHWFLL